MIAGVYWSRIVGPIVGIAAFLTLFRMLSGWWGIVLGMFAFGFCSWWGETHWARQATAQERRAELEDRTRDSPE